MLNIGICDSDKHFTKQLHSLIQNYLTPLHTDWKFSRFHSIDELSNALERGSFQCRLLFADISLKGENSINIAQYISMFCPEIDVIFITSSTELSFDIFPPNTYAWISRSLEQERIENILSQYLSHRPFSSHCLTIKNDAKNYKIPLHSILYIEGHRHQVIVHTSQRDYTCYRSLQELEKHLSRYGFIRCHKSYILPISGITQYTAATINCNNTSFHIGRTYKEQVRHALTKWSPPYPLTTVGVDCMPGQSSKQTPPTGALICIEGIFKGAVTHIYPDRSILIGRDGEASDFVLNFPQISRIHCELTYHAKEQEYQLTDYSTNGTFTDSGNRLAKGEPYLLKSGTKLYFGDKQLIYQLG